MDVTRSKRNLVAFDIDGTLLEMSPSEFDTYLRSFEECFGIRNINEDWASYRSATDIGVAKEILRDHFGRESSDAELSQVLLRYRDLIREVVEVPGYEAEVVPGTAEILEAIRRWGDTELILATGNLRSVAEIRLEAAGLWHFFSRGGFAEDGIDKSAILGYVLARSRQERSEMAPGSRCVLIGDSAVDVVAARRNGTHFIGIAHRTRRLVRLQDAGAKILFEDYRDSAAFLDTNESMVMDGERAFAPSASES